MRRESHEMYIGSLPPLAAEQNVKVVSVSLTAVDTWYRMKRLPST